MLRNSVINIKKSRILISQLQIPLGHEHGIMNFHGVHGKNFMVKTCFWLPYVKKLRNYASKNSEFTIFLVKIVFTAT
jgi:hypothetical protein